MPKIKAAAAKFGIHMSDSQNSAPPPRDSLFRAVFPGVAVEDRAGDGDGMPVLRGHFAVFNQWTEINSVFEGHFLERVSPGAFAKTFKENRDNMRVLFQHGRDPQIGDKPLGMIDDVSEDDTGARYSVPLFDTSYNRDLVPGLRAGAYGASFRFRVTREAFNRTPEASEFNPDSLPERTIQEASVSEFGPVTFPAYAGATAGVRSLTDEFLIQAFTREPQRLRELMQHMQGPAQAPLDDAGSTTSSGRRDSDTVRPLVVIRNPIKRGVTK
jgi:HK97 family phage prohead protease